jgi:hypothetical protein
LRWKFHFKGEEFLLNFHRSLAAISREMHGKYETSEELFIDITSHVKHINSNGIMILSTSFRFRMHCGVTMKATKLILKGVNEITASMAVVVAKHEFMSSVEAMKR